MTMHPRPPSNVNVDRSPSLSMSLRWPPLWAIACISVCVANCGCGTLGQRVKDKEDLLAAAGFSVWNGFLRGCSACRCFGFRLNDAPRFCQLSPVVGSTTPLPNS